MKVCSRSEARRLLHDSRQFERLCSHEGRRSSTSRSRRLRGELLTAKLGERSSAAGTAAAVALADQLGATHEGLRLRRSSSAVRSAASARGQGERELGADVGDLAELPARRAPARDAEITDTRSGSRRTRPD